MKALFIYIALIAVAVNIVNTAAQNTAEGLERIQQDRHAALCQVNSQYCL